MKLQEVTAYNLRSQTILNESWETLTESQRIYVGKWEKELWPLLEEYVRVCEAELAPNQIKSIFTSAEQQAAGQKTGLGKAASAAGAALKLPVELAKKVDAKVNELGKLAQNAGPVKNADAKFAQLKKDITANNSDSKIVQGVQRISDWAKANPGKASLAVGILTTMAAFAGGPAGGAAAGLILRASSDLLKGEKLSTAVGKSVKTAAYGAIAGKAFDTIKDLYSGDAVEMAKAASNPKEVAKTAKAVAGDRWGTMSSEDIVKAKRDIAYAMKNGGELPADTVFGNAGDAAADAAGQAKAGAAADAAGQAKAGAAADAAGQAKAGAAADAVGQSVDTFSQYDIPTDKVADLAKQLSDNGLELGVAADTDAGNELRKEITQKIYALSREVADGNVGIEADIRSAIERGINYPQILNQSFVHSEWKNVLSEEIGKDSINYAEMLALYNSLSMEQKYRLHIQEGPLADKLKGAAGKAAGAVKGAASKAASAVKQAGKDVTQQVTANKLMKAWKAAGEPTDTGSIVNILASAGISDDQIATIGQEQKVKLPAPTRAPADNAAGAQEPKADNAAGAQEPKADNAAGAQEPKADNAAGAQEPKADNAVDIKSIAAEIKKLPPEAVQEIKVVLQKELNVA